MQRPTTEEYKPYAQKYIDLVPGGDIRDVLQDNKEDVMRLFGRLPADKHNYSYAPGKWTVKQVLLHMTDVERVLCYRALVAARGDTQTIIHNMDENLYAANAPASGRTMQDLLDEFAAVRHASLHLFRHISKEESTRRTTNHDGTYFTPRSLAYFIVGHGLHHINIIKERY
jgi:uncharacterized damage-inducible protein DinB